MDLQRLARHLLRTPWYVRRAFSPVAMADIEGAITAAELTHAGEIRFAVEDTLDPWALLRGQTPRERAIDVFAQLRVWDTQHNNGVLIYVLLADHAVEIVADRGIQTHAGAQIWSAISHQLEAAFQRGDFRSGAVAGVDEVARVLCQHFPREGGDGNELPDQAVLI